MGEVKLEGELGKDRKAKVQHQFRLVLSKDANASLEELVSLINDGFKAGSVTKVDIASYLFKSAKRLLSKSEICKIRNEFFDEKMALQNLLREAELTGVLPKEIRKLLKEQHRIAVEDQP